jgi:hypothetical protein
MAGMSDSVSEVLDAARSAYAQASEALRLAEAAARAAGVEVTPAVVDELTVKRINVVEDDGTLRIVIGNSTHGRRLAMRGRLVDHPGREDLAGLLFINDEGTECGGLQFGGGRRGDVVEHGGFLTFDDFEQNESFRLGQVQDAGGSRKWLEFADLPDWSLADMIEEMEGLEGDAAREVQERYFAGQGSLGASRIRLAREDDGSVRLVLRDARGQDRLRFVVPADGEPVAEILDVDGTSRSLVPDQHGS